jgi:hypothetical protein
MAINNFGQILAAAERGGRVTTVLLTPVVDGEPPVSFVSSGTALVNPESTASRGERLRIRSKGSLCGKLSLNGHRLACNAAPADWQSETTYSSPIANSPGGMETKASAALRTR